MDNNQNGNNNLSFGMLNNNSVNPSMQINNNYQNSAIPINENNQGGEGPSIQIPANNNSNDVVTLGTVSNVTYADTIGNIDYGAPEIPEIQNFDNANINNDNFINNEYNETSLSDLNVEGTYNNMNAAPDYISDPQVMANIHPEKKNTITITKEIKTFIVIALVLLVFILIMPYLFDLFNKIRFH